jgi:hypothetical protein
LAGQRLACFIIEGMRAVLRDIIFSPNPRTLPGDPANFAFGVQLLVGPADGPGEESFLLTVCSPEWLAARCGGGELVNGLHHVIVSSGAYDERMLREWLRRRVASAEAASWQGVTAQLSLLGEWEFEDYRP